MQAQAMSEDAAQEVEKKLLEHVLEEDPENVLVQLSEQVDEDGMLHYESRELNSI